MPGQTDVYYVRHVDETVVVVAFVTAAVVSNLLAYIFVYV